MPNSASVAMQFSLKRIFLVLAISASAGFGCSVPVFRYALDRWQPDFFRLEAPALVFKTNPLAAELRSLGQAGTINLEALQSENEPADNTARITFPQHRDEKPANLWSGALNKDAFKVLMDSPARTDFARRIISGDSAVWVLVGSGKAEVDDAAEKLLKERIKIIEAEADLPPIDPEDPTSKLGPGPALQKKLSVLRIRRDDPAESAFIAMLAGPGGLAAFPADQPFAALAFGRGRALGAWSGKDLTADLIEEATLFLFGACSCEIKNLNPGWDLLVNVDWDGELGKTELTRLEAVSASGEPEQPRATLMPETVTISPQAAVTVNPSKLSVSPLGAFLVINGALLVIAILFLLKIRKKS